MSKKKEEEKIADTAAGQRAFVDAHLPEDKAEEDPKLKILRLSVLLYIEEAESAKKQLLKKVEVEEFKNKTVKRYLEILAREMLMHFPNHGLAEEALALLLEDKMSTLHLTDKAVTANPPVPMTTSPRKKP